MDIGMKQTHKRNGYLCITLLWIAVIFSFSLQSGEDSGQLSGGVVSWIVETLSLTKFMDLDTIHFLVRKTAHFTEYFILGTFTYLTLQQTKFPGKKAAGILFCIMVASFDETIQLFVGGRAGQLMDVALDGTGSLCGIFFMCLWSVFYDKIAARYVKKQQR
uniref:VanZ family protein n=1 Tax=Agathobacter sp. TaxID=2021311 RepID=UPI004055EFBE